ncbi:MAG: hypothetical protein ACOX62_02795 [Christensenellales bacterium]
MLRRLFWLVLCCAALCLLLGLMAHQQTEPRPYPLRIQSFSAIPVPASEDGPKPIARLRAPSVILLHVAACRRVEDYQLMPGLPFHRQNYQAFHYPDEAG